MHSFNFKLSAPVLRFFLLFGTLFIYRLFSDVTLHAVVDFRSDLSDEPTESDSGSDYSDQQRQSSR